MANGKCTNRFQIWQVFGFNVVKHSIINVFLITVLIHKIDPEIFVELAPEVSLLQKWAGTTSMTPTTSAKRSRSSSAPSLSST
jgi:hypothetical protein